MILRKRALAVIVALCMAATMVPGMAVASGASDVSARAGGASDVSARTGGNSGTWEEIRDERVLQVDKVGVKAEVKLAEGEILRLENSDERVFECEFFESYDGKFEDAGSAGVE